MNFFVYQIPEIFILDTKKKLYSLCSGKKNDFLERDTAEVLDKICLFIY